MTSKSIKFDQRQRAILAILTLSSFIVVLDFASAFIPLPTIMEQLNGTIDEGTWVITGFVLPFSIFLYPCASFAAFFGSRKLFIAGILLFAVSSIACALSVSMLFLIGARVFLGIGAAMVEASVYSLLMSVFPENKQGAAFKVQGTAFIAGALAAPVLSGAVTTLLSWKFLYGFNAITGVAVLLFATRVIPESIKKETAWRLDLPGLLLSGGGLFFLFYAMIEGARLKWHSPLILGAFGTAVILLSLFVWVELRMQNPMIGFNLFKDRLFSIGNGLRGASEFASMGIYFILSHFMQVQLGHSALFAGFLLMTVIAGGLIAASITEPLAKRIDGRALIIPGFLLVAGGTFWLAHVTPNTTWTFFLAPLAIAGAGFTAQEGPTLKARDEHIDSKNADAAWRISYSIFLLGIGFGVSVVSAIWQSQIMSALMANLNGTHLSSGVVNKVTSNLFTGGISGNPTGVLMGNERLKSIIQLAFSQSVNRALLCCVVMALMGAGMAMLFTKIKSKRG